MEPGLVVAIVALVAIIGAFIVQGVTYRALHGWRERLQGLDDALLGDGRDDLPPGEVREAELRQLLEASSYRRQQKGLEPLDVEAELRRLLKRD